MAYELFCHHWAKLPKRSFGRYIWLNGRRRRIFWQNCSLFALTRRILALQNKQSSVLWTKYGQFLSRIRTFWWKSGLFAKKFTKFFVIIEHFPKKIKNFVLTQIYTTPQSCLCVNKITYKRKYKGRVIRVSCYFVFKRVLHTRLSIREKNHVWVNLC